MKIAPYILSVFLATQLMAGCSVFMAASGENEKNVSVVKKGATRGEVEVAMGQPIKTSVNNENTVVIYQYVVGNQPSGGRAVGHAAMDILTLGLWEVVGTGIEAANQGDTYELTVTYDGDDVVQKVSSTKVR